MDNLVRQPDGMYALTFKNYNKIPEDEVREIFQEYGDIVSIRKSSDQVPWIFVRYKEYDEASAAFKNLKNCKQFEIRVATSGRKTLEHGGDEREKETKGGDTREKGNIKGNRSRNNFAECSPKEDGDHDSRGSASKPPLLSNRTRNTCVERSPKEGAGGDNHMEDTRGPAHKISSSRTRNNFIERSPKEDDGDDNQMEGARGPAHKISFNRRRNPNVEVNKNDKEDEDEIEAVGTNLKKISLQGNIKHKQGNSDEVESHISSHDEGPPKLIRATEFYGSLTLQNPYESGLACRAAFSEVWASHPLRKEMELKEVIFTNFEYVPTKREIIELCSDVRLLHVSIDVTPKEMPYCRVLVATEDDAARLYELDGCEYNGSTLYVSSLEYILDDLTE